MTLLLLYNQTYENKNPIFTSILGKESHCDDSDIFEYYWCFVGPSFIPNSEAWGEVNVFAARAIALVRTRVRTMLALRLRFSHPNSANTVISIDRTLACWKIIRYLFYVKKKLLFQERTSLMSKKIFIDIELSSSWLVYFWSKVIHIAINYLNVTFQMF